MRTHPGTSTLTASVLVLLCLGCEHGGTSSPTAAAEPPPNATNGFIFGQVIGQSGECLSGAAIEIVSGPGTGRKTVQTQACDAWSYVSGYEISNLPVGARVKLRAMQVSYRPQEREGVVHDGGTWFQFALSPE